jgi:crotonobetaine/carnitine-CoA ligase
VEWTQANEVFAAYTMAAAASIGPPHRVLVVLPLTTVLARSYSVAAAVAAGAHVVLAAGNGFVADDLPEQIRRYRITHDALDAAEVAAVLHDRGDARVITGALEHCWCAPALGARDAAAFTAWLGCEPRGLLGTPQTVAAVLTERDATPVRGALGTVTPGCDVDVVDADGNAVPIGAVGELVVRGEAGLTLFAGARGSVVHTGVRVRCRDDGRYEAAAT